MPGLTGYAQSFPGGTSETWTTPYPIAPGTQARDSKGNEFVFVSRAALSYSGQLMTINDETWAATAITTSGRGKVGVNMQGGAAATGGWLQVYGRVLMQVGGSVVSPSDAANGPTTDNTSLQVGFSLPTSVTTPTGIPYMTTDASSGGTLKIVGIQIAIGASAADVSGHAGQGGVQSRESTPAVTAVTSAASFIGSSVYVFLNHPYIVRAENS